MCCFIFVGGGRESSTGKSLTPGSTPARHPAPAGCRVVGREGVLPSFFLGLYRVFLWSRSSTPAVHRSGPGFTEFFFNFFSSCIRLLVARSLAKRRRFYRVFFTGFSFEAVRLAGTGCSTTEFFIHFLSCRVWLSVSKLVSTQFTFYRVFFTEFPFESLDWWRPVLFSTDLHRIAIESRLQMLPSFFFLWHFLKNPFHRGVSP